MEALLSMQNFGEFCLTEQFPMVEPATIIEIRLNLSRVFTRYAYHLVNAFNKPLHSLGYEGRFRLTYFDLCQFFKFMNVNSFKFESSRIEPLLNGFVRDQLKNPFFNQYFDFQLGAASSPTKKPTATRRQSVISLGPAIPTGEQLLDAYMKYYQYTFSIEEFIHILVSVVFGLYHKEIQSESHILKSIGLNKEDASPTKMTAYASNIGLFMERFLQICGLSCSKLGFKHPFRYLQSLTPCIDSTFMKEYGNA